MATVGQVVTLPADLVNTTAIHNLLGGLGCRTYKAEIVEITDGGVCKLILPKGKKIGNGGTRMVTSKDFDGRYVGHEMVSLHQDFIRELAP